MTGLHDKNVAVIGASRGLGRVIATSLHAEGMQVLAVARTSAPLLDLANTYKGMRVCALDAAADDASERVFQEILPDVLIVCGGARPPIEPLQELEWAAFSANWNSDVKASFQFCKATLRRPLRPGSLVILISSGAGIGGSPISGGYAGAKRMQMFLAGYAQKESDRLGLGLRFVALAPARIMPETELGKAAVEGYSRYLGVPPAEFIRGMSARQSVDDVARAVKELAIDPAARRGTAFSVSGEGVQSIP